LLDATSMIRIARCLPLVVLCLAACAAEDGYRDAPPPPIDEGAAGADGKLDGTWLDAVESLDGLPGTYVRGTFGVLPLLALRVDGDDRDGVYEAWWRVGLTGQRFETGAYSSIPENAAIGFAAITLVPDGGTAEDSHFYAIRRVQRDATAITRLELQMLEFPYLTSSLYRVDP
jgi:hypothetical protein